MIAADTMLALPVTPSCATDALFKVVRPTTVMALMDAFAMEALSVTPRLAMDVLIKVVFPVAVKTVVDRPVVNVVGPAMVIPVGLSVILLDVPVPPIKTDVVNAFVPRDREFTLPPVASRD